MPEFEIDCPIIGEIALITLEGTQVRGEPALRGFACEHEAGCENAGVECALFRAGAPAPFDVKDAFRFLGQ